jgi:hypothetical protein
MEEHESLMNLLIDLKRKQIKWLLSNHKCDFMDEKFPTTENYNKIILSAKRRIHSKNPESKVDEYLIYPSFENHKNTKQVRQEGFDKFYTIPSYSKQCIQKIFELYPIEHFDFIIEPSAGNGSFYHQIPTIHKIGIDILPEHHDIIQQDYFQYTPPSHYQNILVVGNPPFGKNSSLAIQFFNHSAQWANIIAFIIPRTFRKISVQNKLHTSFHLIYDEDVPINPCCFSPPMMAKCCFQIWERKHNVRQIIHLPTTHHDWNFLPFGPLDINGQPTPPSNAQFAMRAYGGKIGEIITENLHSLRPKSYHWFQSNINMHELIERFQKLDYSNSLNTARQNSMGRAELVQLYTDFFNSIS